MNLSSDLERVRAYYASRLVSHGPTAQGVDWNSTEAQELRFAQLLRVREADRSFTLGDYGCGYGALAGWLAAHGGAAAYRGYDIGGEMVETARSLYGRVPGLDCAFSTEEAVLDGVDYLVASGLFNVKLDADMSEWRAYLLRTLDRFAVLARRGFAFNALTSYSDPERMRPNLYYAEPCFLFHHCMRYYSRNVALLHDYGLYDFTILVRF